MKSLQDEAVVLRKRSVKEKDEVVILLAQRHGKIACMSYGSRDPKSRKAGGLQLFNTIAFEARQGNAKMPVLQQVKTLKRRAFSLLEEKQDLDAYYQASEILRLTDELFHDEQSVQSVYSLLNNALDAVGQASAALVYTVQLLDLLGYLPQWSHCSHCHESLQLSDELVFSCSHRGFAHQRCCDEYSFQIQDGDLIKIMSFWQHERFEQGIRVDASAEQLIEARRLLTDLELHDSL